MESFINWIYNSFYQLLETLTESTMKFIDNIFVELFWGGSDIKTLDFNLVLFSDTPIFTMPIYDLVLLFFSIFYTIIFVVVVWKIIKKVFVKITGWNRW